MSEEFFTRRLDNGMVLLAQRMGHVSSAAMTLLVPAGAAHDAAGADGAASVAAEWCFRGAGDRDTRQLNDALDALGCQRGETVRSEHVRFSSAQLGRNLHDVLALYADVLRRPRLSDATFEPCRNAVMQDLASLEDEPARKCNLLLREQFYPWPLGRCPYGHADALKALTPEAVREHVARGFSPSGAILAVAGNVDWDGLCAAAEAAFGDFAADAPPPVQPEPARRGVRHIAKDSAQQHIALAHASVPLSDERYYAARTAQTVLSGGMGSRLFAEVREKRGLVYHVSCRYNTLKDQAGLFTYAGTRPEVAQETFDVTVGELRRLREGITPDELARAKTQLKSSLVMQGESTGARARMLATDWYHLGRLRGLAEISDAIDAVTADDVLAYLDDYPAEDFTVLVIGPQDIETGATSA
ncbi:MAG: insulinase family protein [Phycisphaerae bacterium]|nr:insulinase family protein [Phycisphaerae bacterium]